MTYCLGIKVKQGIVAIADTRLTSGTETTTAKKYFIHESGQHSIFLMTSGLRSIRDKALTYFKEVISDDDHGFTRMYEAVNALGEQIRKVAKEDKASLAESGLEFNLHTIIGGQLEADKESKLYLLYPQGNWIEVSEGSPFFIIGNSGYGKPVLRRTLSYQSTMRFALKTGFLSFDSTRVSANDVDFPIDVIVYHNNSFEVKVHRFTEQDMRAISKLWGDLLRDSINQIPDEWMSEILL
jgi:putative proteasome-type protease